MEKDYPELNDRIASTPINLQLRVANGETIRSTESVCVPVRIDFSEDYSQTAFAVTDTGNENIPFILAIPQLSKLEIVIDTTPGNGYMVSRKTGFAYKLRKPKQHLLWNMIRGPMINLRDIPKHIDVNSVWKTPGNSSSKHDRRSSTRKTHFR